MINNKQPFFILGNPRSGTTLFRLMLNSHPELVVPPECGFSEWFINEFSRLKFNEITYIKFAKAVYSSKKFETWGVSYNSLMNTICHHAPKNYRELCFCVYLSYARKVNKEPLLVGDKNNYYINKVDHLERHFPKSKKIFIIRDGRDVASSYLNLRKINSNSKYFPSLTNSISEVACQWLKSASVALEYRRKGAVLIKYEDLIANPEVTLRSICCYLRIDYSSLMLDYYKYNDEPAEFLEWKEKTQREIMSENKGGYLTNLTKSKVREFEEVAGSALKIFGYN